jgi:hypothetical protein
MLNGIDPILIFQLYKLLPSTQATIANIPLTSEVKKKATFAVIPIYLSEKITGIYIDHEGKNIDINTDTNSLTDGSPALINQKTLGSITTIELVAKQGSVGLTILLALTELLLDKVTSQEYEVTYMHGAVTVFGGLVHSFSYDMGTNDDLYKIKLELSRGRPKTKSLTVAEDPSAVRLASTGTVPQAGASTVTNSTAGASGSSVIRPGGGRLP